MGTGWLISKDIVVTAAHCLYDSNGGYLRSIKVYIGYEGPEETALERNSCEMRLGTVATIPAEYIKTGHTVHDVGFVSTFLNVLECDNHCTDEPKPAIHR